MKFNTEMWYATQVIYNIFVFKTPLSVVCSAFILFKVYSMFCHMKPMPIYLPGLHWCGPQQSKVVGSQLHACCTSRPHCFNWEKKDCPPGSATITCVCVWVQYIWVSMHPLNIVILLPLYSSHMSYKMTHLRNCCLSRQWTPSAPPCCSWGSMCVLCV